MLFKILDWLRIIAVAVAFFFGYQIGFRNGYDPFAQLHFMIPIIVVAIAGLSGLESVFFGRKAAEMKGFETGSNYQKQSGIALLSYAFIALLVFFCQWGIKAELTVLLVFMFFFFFSAINHGMEAIKHKNYKWQNVNRPFITLLLIAGLIYPVVKALQSF